MFIPREIVAELIELSSSFPVVTITGPRQSGKTTLVRNVFPHKKYFSLEDPDTRQLALSKNRVIMFYREVSSLSSRKPFPNRWPVEQQS